MKIVTHALWIAGTLILSTTALYAHDLPLERSVAPLEEQGFVRFPSPSKPHPLAPIGAPVLLNGTSVSTTLTGRLAELIEEIFYIRILPGQPIQVLQNSRAIERWDFPTGTEVAHLTRLKFPVNDSAISSILELRAGQKLSDGTWMFGIYQPTTQNTLKLAVDTDEPWREMLAPDGKGDALNLRFKRLPLGTCKFCHFNTSAGFAAYPDEQHAGPCGFIPTHKELRSQWSREFEKQTGFVPFVDTRK